MDLWGGQRLHLCLLTPAEQARSNRFRSRTRTGLSVKSRVHHHHHLHPFYFMFCKYNKIYKQMFGSRCSGSELGVWVKLDPFRFLF